MKRKIGISFIIALIFLMRPPALSSAEGPGAYPEMSDEELGQLRWALAVADQDLDDFTNLEGIDQAGMTAYRYALAFMTYFLAAEQYHKLPACPGIIQPRMDRLIQKMTLKPVWEFWAEISRGLIWLEPDMDRPYPEERDPVKFRNIMYSGHVGHMVGLYEMLYRDRKYDQPGSIVFEWSPQERFEYNHESLNMVMYNQMANLPQHCVECEPNACFPECNQHPILSFLLFDQQHGTKLFDASRPFLDFFIEKNMIDPQTHRAAMLYLVKQDLTVSQQDPRYHNAFDLVTVPLIGSNIYKIASATADGWTAAFMHAWEPDLIEREYPYMKTNNLRDVTADQARLTRTDWEPQLQYGFFAILAAEMGDPETRDKLIAYADNHYAPAWQDGALRYPYNLTKGCTNLTGQLIAIARALPPDGMRLMHNEPLKDRGPVLTEVDFPNILVKKAIYDESKDALVMTLAPGGQKAGDTQIKITRLDPAKNYVLTIDGGEAKKLAGQTELALQLTVDARRDLILAAEK